MNRSSFLAVLVFIIAILIVLVATTDFLGIKSLFSDDVYHYNPNSGTVTTEAQENTTLSIVIIVALVFAAAVILFSGRNH